MEAAPARHPSSIMSLHSTRQGGRGSQGRSRSDGHAPREIVGEVILRGKRHLWGQPDGHYHHGLPAGENTLNAWCARELMATMSSRGEYDADAWLSAYIDLLCADPPRHPDTYAESYHRGFFANLEAGKSPRACAAITHDTPSMGALVTLAPLALALFPHQALEAVQAICRQHVALTHPDDSLARVVDAYVELMHTLIYEAEANAGDAPYIRAARAVAGTRLERLLERTPAEVVGGTFGLACYISDSWPSVCYLAARFRQDPAAGLLCNANLGGENAHRGAVLGTLLGLAAGLAPPALFGQLARQEEISEAIEHWQERFHGG